MAETHAPQFRGVWIPAEVLERYASGEINAADMLLLMIIDSLVAPDRGCYASNKYLAERTGRHEINTSKAIARLKKIGLLREVGFNGRRRVLETAWSRINPPPKRLRKGSLRLI